MRNYIRYGTQYVHSYISTSKISCYETGFEISYEKKIGKKKINK